MRQNAVLSRVPSSRVHAEEGEERRLLPPLGFPGVESAPPAASSEDVARAVRDGIEVELRHLVYPERHAGDAPGDDFVPLRVPDPCHAEVDCSQDDRGQGLYLVVPEQADVLESVGLLDVADGVLDPPAGNVALHDLPEGLARRCLREGRQQHHRLLPEPPHDDHVQEPVRDVGKPHGHGSEFDRHAPLGAVVVERHGLPVAHPAFPGEFAARDASPPAAHVSLPEADDEIKAFFKEIAVELDVVAATVAYEYAPPLRVPRDFVNDGLHLLVLADEPGRGARSRHHGGGASGPPNLRIRAAPDEEGGLRQRACGEGADSAHDSRPAQSTRGSAERCGGRARSRHRPCPFPGASLPRQSDLIALPYQFHRQKKGNSSARGRAAMSKGEGGDGQGNGKPS